MTIKFKSTVKNKFAMAHGNVNEICRKLDKKIDGTTNRAPWNQSLYEILKAPYTLHEAELLVRMPYGISCFEQTAHSIKNNQEELHQLLENLCEKGLVFDIWLGDHYRYALAPMVVSIFEMTMMRTRGELRFAEWARLFNDPLSISHKFMRGFIRGFLRLTPVKQKLMSDLLRSRFLNVMKAGAQKKNNKQVLQKTKEI